MSASQSARQLKQLERTVFLCGGGWSHSGCVSGKGAVLLHLCTEGNREPQSGLLHLVGRREATCRCQSDLKCEVAIQQRKTLL